MEHWLRVSIPICLALLVTVLPAHGSPAPGKMWVLKQVGSRGAMQMLVTDNALRIDCPQEKFVAILKGPPWTVMLFRPCDKLEFASSLSQWIKKGNVWFDLGMNERPEMHSKPRSTIYKGLKASYVTDELRIAPHHHDWTLSDLKKETVTMRPAAMMKRHYDRAYVWSEELTKSLPICQFMAAFHNFPDCPGFPLEYFRGQSQNHPSRSHGFYTASICQKPIDLKQFEMPGKFEKTDNQWDILLGHGYNKEMTEQMQDLGVGEQFGSKH